MERKEITKNTWRMIVFGILVLGIIVWSIFTPTLSLTPTEKAWYIPSLAGSLIIGFGLGLMYSRYFKIKGIDDS